MKMSKTVGKLMLNLAKAQSEFPEFKDDSFGYEKKLEFSFNAEKEEKRE